jgi:hypothetical protein
MKIKQFLKMIGTLACLYVTLCKTNPIWIVLEFNPGILARGSRCHNYSSSRENLHVNFIVFRSLTLKYSVLMFTGACIIPGRE